VYNLLRPRAKKKESIATPLLNVSRLALIWHFGRKSRKKSHARTLCSKEALLTGVPLLFSFEGERITEKKRGLYCVRITAKKEKCMEKDL
jgi:hypothetical protein